MALHHVSLYLWEDTFHFTTPVGGSGGCTVALVVNDEATEFLARGYRIVYPFGNLPIILFDVDGTECGGSGSTNCIFATVWGDEKFEHTKNSN